VIHIAIEYRDASKKFKNGGMYNPLDTESLLWRLDDSVAVTGFLNQY